MKHKPISGTTRAENAPPVCTRVRYQALPGGEKDMVGSGYIFDDRGYILTNRHVTGGKRHVKVKLNDGTDLAGEIVVADADQDLAVVRHHQQESKHDRQHERVEGLDLDAPEGAPAAPHRVDPQAHAPRAKGRDLALEKHLGRLGKRGEKIGDFGGALVQSAGL